jgi:hypothetical protein
VANILAGGAGAEVSAVGALVAGVGAPAVRRLSVVPSAGGGSGDCGNGFGLDVGEGGRGVAAAIEAVEVTVNCS